MSESKVKVPMKNGLAKARQKLKQMRIKKFPSPDLVKIIGDVTRHTPDEKDTQNKIPPINDDIAARPKKRPQDLDL